MIKPVRELSRVPTCRTRLIVALLVGVVSTLIAAVMRYSQGGDGADFRQALWMARDLLTGHDPYDYFYYELYVPYPLPTALFGLPFLVFPEPLGACVFVGVSSGLLAFGLTREGYQRLALFFCAPYWLAIFLAQWSPLISAAAFFWWLAPVLLVKPQIALPVILRYSNWRGWIAIGVVGLGSLLVMPTWPVRWLSGIGDYQRISPLLSLHGVLLLFALFRYRDRDALMLLIGAALPQRAMYDLVWLWLIPNSLNAYLITALVSWIVVIAPFGITLSRSGMFIWSAYIPMLVVILLRGRHNDVARHNPTGHKPAMPDQL